MLSPPLDVSQPPMFEETEEPPTQALFWATKAARVGGVKSIDPETYRNRKWGGTSTNKGAPEASIGTVRLSECHSL